MQFYQQCTGIIKYCGDYQGVIERFAHTRNFTQINLDFYVDNEYKSLKFLEHWMEFIIRWFDCRSLNDSYHFKMRYPDEYKSNDTRIVKFEKNHFQFLEYRFIGMFPLSLIQQSILSKFDCTESNCMF